MPVSTFRVVRNVVCSFAVWWITHSVPMAANEWTRFQGPPTSKPTTRIPLQWSASDNVAWTAEITGYGQSSPVTWGERVFLTSISGPKKERCHVAAFALLSGKKLWQYDLDAATQAENNNYISKAAPTPVVDAAGLVCFFEGGNLVALTHDGQVRWQRNLVTEFGAIESRHGLAASLEQNADHAFVWVERAQEPYVLAVAKTSGKDIWKSRGLGATSWASPRLVPVKSGEHLVLSGIGVLTGLDPATGQHLWRFQDIHGNSTPTPVPAGEGRFLIGATVGRGEADSGKASESNGLIAIKQHDDGFHAEFVWKAKRATSSFGSPIAHRGHAYFVNATGVLFCLDLETGEERYSQRLADSIWATPLWLGDRLYFFGKGGQTTVIAAGDKFEKLAENAISDAAASAPAAGQGATRNFGGPVLYAAAFVDNRLLLRRGNHLYCIAGP